jgi:hypothetical protein
MFRYTAVSETVPSILQHATVNLSTRCAEANRRPLSLYPRKLLGVALSSSFKHVYSTTRMALSALSCLKAQTKTSISFVTCADTLGAQISEDHFVLYGDGLCNADDTVLLVRVRIGLFSITRLHNMFLRLTSHGLYQSGI